MQRARNATSGGEHLLPVAHNERLHDAIVGMQFLSSDWETRVRMAETEPELARLRATLERAPIDQTVRASKAKLLLVAVDEPKVGSGPTELDGACPHHVRVYLFDAETSATLLRLRKFVDPTPLSDDARIPHAGGINACELALAVHAEIGAN